MRLTRSNTWLAALAVVALLGACSAAPTAPFGDGEGDPAPAIPTIGDLEDGPWVPGLPKPEKR